MPAFATPEPISVNLDVPVGDVRIIAADRTDTVVEVRPADESRAVDVRAAEQTKVDYADGNLQVRGSKRFNSLIGPGSKDGSVDVRIELPAGSRLHGSLALGGLRCEGRLGECELKTGLGAVWLEHSGALRASTGGGDITVGHVTGHAEIRTGFGEVRIREIDGTAVVKNSVGATRIGDVAGDVRVKAASGDISIDRAQAGVVAKTAAGKIVIGEVCSGSVMVETGGGGLEIGVREGTAAWLDVHSKVGSVRSLLETSEAPDPSGPSVQVRARTPFGDILIRRSSLATRD
jgi:Putative adhesin